MDFFGLTEEQFLPCDGEARLFSEVWSPNECHQIETALTHNLAWEQLTVEVFNRRVPQPRLTCWYGDEDKNYSYSGVSLVSLPWIPLLADIRKKCEEISGAQFNSVLANLYRTGADSISWHSDNEPELGPQPTIASVTFGATRRFDMRHRDTKEVIQINLLSGSILVMSGLSQVKWQHQIAKTKKQIGPRINLTFRTIHV
jgi:alkylated DNA repair dioxygenase AlkB